MFGALPETYDSYPKKKHHPKKEFFFYLRKDLIFEKTESICSDRYPLICAQLGRRGAFLVCSSVQLTVSQQRAYSQI